MNNKLLKRRRLRDLPLGYKFSFLVSGVVIMLGIASIFFVESKVSHALHIEHRERGFTIARHLATHCVDLILTENRIKLYQLLSDIKSKEKDVAYLFVVDGKKEVFVHTFGKEGFPKVLLTATPLTDGESFSYNQLQFDNDKNIVDELTVPLLEGTAGELHIGLSEKFILEKIRTLRMQLIGITSIICLFGIFSAFFFARIMSKPLQTLSYSFRQIWAGRSNSGATGNCP